LKNGQRANHRVGRLVVLTGASAGGKSTLARAVEDCGVPGCEVLFFDSIGVPSEEEMRAFGVGHQPGGAWQRAATIQWMQRIAGILEEGRAVLFEGQMRIAFIVEALALSGLDRARVLLVDCDDATRVARLRGERNQPELATADMMAWSAYLRNEAMQAGCGVLDTGSMPISTCVGRIVAMLTDSED
jgi:dephospho-CoA kinase